MHERLLGLVAKGMDACDMTGEKIGTVAAVYPHMGVTVQSASHQWAAGEAAEGEGSYIKVNTGLLGLGKTLYIPAEYLSDVRDYVLVDVQKDHLDQMGWGQRPPGVDNEQT